MEEVSGLFRALVRQINPIYHVFAKPHARCASMIERKDLIHVHVHAAQWQY
jgi:hypothetical protein